MMMKVVVSTFWRFWAAKWCFQLEFENFWCQKRMIQWRYLLFFFCRKYKMKAILLFFTIQVRTSSDIISGEFLSIGLMSSQHFAGGKDPPRRKQIQNLWKKTAAMNKSMESSPETLRLGSFLTFKFDQRDRNWNILPQQNRLFWACEERFQRENLKVCCEKDNLQSLRCGVHVLPHCGPTNHRLRHGILCATWVLSTIGIQESDCHWPRH